jgi:3-oxoadipate enol-lactonase
VTSGPVRLDALRVGRGRPAIMVLHPVGLDGPALGSLAACLADGRVAMAPSLRGHGASPAPAGPWTVRELAADLHRLLSEAELAPADVLGISLGGMVAQQLAIDHPSAVRSLVLVSTTGGFDESARAVIRQRGERALEGGMEAVVDETLARWFSPAARAGDIPARVRARLLEDDPRSWAATWDAMAGFDARPQLGQVEQPALVMTGAEDASTPPSVAAQLTAALPRARLHVVPGAGHLAPLEHPDRYARLVADFLGPSSLLACAS